jgi:predicted RNase H-like HicB family nuclease
MTQPLRLTIDYEDGEGGWIVASIREVPGAASQGRTRGEARAMVIDALRELTLYWLEEHRPPTDATTLDSEEVQVTIA